MIDKTALVSGTLCKILSRELPKAAEWRPGVRCRGGFAGISLDSPLENARDAVRDAEETREGEGGCDEIKGVVTGDETTPTLELHVAELTLLCISFFRQGCCPPSLLSQPGDRDVVRRDLVTADKVNNRRRSNRDLKLIGKQVT